MKFDMIISSRLFKGCLAVALLGMSSCRIILQSPEKQVSLESRYQKMNKSVEDDSVKTARVIVDVKSDLLPEPSPGKINLLNFSGEGQNSTA